MQEGEAYTTSTFKALLDAKGCKSLSFPKASLEAVMYRLLSSTVFILRFLVALAGTGF